MKWKDVWERGKKLKEPKTPDEWAFWWLAYNTRADRGEGKFAASPKPTVESLRSTFRKVFNAGRAAQERDSAIK